MVDTGRMAMSSQRFPAEIAAHISQERLRSDIEATGSFGAIESDSDEQHGRSAVTGTDANRQAREYFVSQLQAAGLSVRIDPVGNIAGRWEPDSCDPTARPIAVGSHLDSVPNGGIFDGPLGVYAGLESVRAMQDAGISPERPVDVVSFTEEEGHRFTDGVAGSSVAAGLTNPEAVLSATDGSETLGDALARIGFAGTDRIDARQWNSWLELHVEQSDRLETTETTAGIVTAIAGTVRCQISVDGEANHAGTTTMDDRSDALVAASTLVVETERIGSLLAADENPSTVATVGKMDISPGAVNVIPGRVDLRLEVRATDQAIINEALQRIQATLDKLGTADGISTSFETPYRIQPTAMTERCQRALRKTADSIDVSRTTLPSMAGHDTMQLANATDVGLLFAPSKNGVSHNPAEWTSWDDCTHTTAVLAGGVGVLATE